MEQLPPQLDGKIDHAPPLAAEESCPLPPSSFAPPRNATEEALAAIWGGLLRCRHIGIHDNFFELGGHSLLAARTINRMCSALGVKLSLLDLFEHPTIAALAAHVAKAVPTEEVPVIARRTGGGPWPLSFAQERLLFLDRLLTNRAVYNVPVAVEWKGTLDVESLQRALNTIIARHEPLRTTFRAGEECDVQEIAAEATVTIQAISLRHLSAEDGERETRRVLEEEARRPFDLGKDLMLRALVVELSDQEHILLLTFHHIAIDEWSLDVFFRELGEIYGTYVNRRSDPGLPALSIRYRDHALWQREWLQGDVLQRELSYWTKQLHGVESLTLPTDRPRPSEQSYQGAWEREVLPKDLSERLRVFSREEGVSLFILLLTAFHTLLYRYSGQDDICVGSPIANRTRSETEHLIGFFVNTLVMRTDFRGEPRFRELLGRVRKMVWEALAHQELPFERLVQELRPARSGRQSPLFQVMFVLNNTAVGGLTLPEISAIREIGTGTAKFGLTLFVEDRAGLIETTLEYSTDVFDRATARRMLGHYRTLLEAAVEDPDQQVSHMPILDEAERRQLLVEWNDTKREYPQLCVHQLIEAQADRTPDAIAVVYGNERVSYSELDRRANQLAHFLRKFGVGPDVLVGLAMERSVELVVSLLAIFKAGGAYVPIDPDYPAERVAFMLSDAAVAILLVQQHLIERLPVHSGATIAVDALVKELERESETAPLGGVSPDNLAYVIYTSGSTGRPKGALNSHRGVVNRLCWMQDAYKLDATDRVLQKTPFSFDVSVWEFFWTLMTGATLVVARPGGHRDPAYLAQLISREGITTLVFVPSMLQIFLDEPSIQECQSLRRVMCSGEALPYDLQQRFFDRCGAELHNQYGPTETGEVTYWQCERHALSHVVPIGRPISNTQIYLLDPNRNPVPVGVTGELYIGGAGVGLGYLNRTELTAEKFLRDPFSDQPGARLYRTGDLARYLPSGAIEYLGRTDRQVKIRGFRVELGEIEAAVRQHPAVKQAVVVAREDTPGDRSLAAYLVPSGAAAPERSEIRDLLKRTLPDYMVPADYVVIEAIPISPNGKIDWKALPAPASFSARRESGVVAPQTETERRLTDIWKEVLEVKEVGIYDDFFELGGHSLGAVRVLTRVRSGFGVDLDVGDFFGAPTVAHMAKLIALRQANFAEVHTAATLPERPRATASGERAVSSVQHNLVYPLQCVHELFEKQVEDRPDAVALVHQSRRVTYRELNRLANGVAHELQRWNLPADSVVALCVDRSPEMVAGMLGILKAGAAYLPLDPAWPPERLALMLADSDARLLLTQSALLPRFPQWSAATLIADDIRGCDWAGPRVATTPEGLAYVMYTSGSTGTPKGVEIPHRGIVRLLFGTDYARFGPDRVFLQMAPFSFDASTFEIWGALLHGGRCVLYPETVPLSSTLGALLRREQVTTLWLTSSLFNALIDDDPAILRTVEQLLIGGEALSVRHVARALELLPDTEIINGYGPTESTTFACCYRIPRDWPKLPDSIPIGRPIGRTQVYILDEQLAPVPVGETGEIYIGGDGLARGYRNRPELTRATFLPNPLRQDGTRLYKTGDLARYLLDGNIEFLGRKDDQVKIRGFRVELGEIEAALARHPAVEQAAVRVYELEPGDKYLAAYVVMPHWQTAAAAELRGYLSDRLPGYMIPSSFQVVDRLPLTANGKLDRSALPLSGTARPPASSGCQAESHRLRQVSFSQENLWLMDRLYPGNPANNVSTAVELHGPLDAAALAAALDAIVERHSALRTTFVAVDGVPMQTVSPSWTCPLRELDLTANRDGCAAAVREEARRTFDLASDLMLSALLVRLADEQHVLVLTVHHIAFDGWSLGILFRELSQLYNALAVGMTPHLPELPIQYADYAERQREQLKDGGMDRALLYWRRQLDGAATLRLPLDHPDAPGEELRGGTLETHLEPGLVSRLDKVARQEGATLFMVLLAGFQALLHRSTGQEDIQVGTAVANRLQEETEGLIGFFVNTLIARSRVQSGRSFRELLGSVRKAMLDAYKHQDAPFEKLVETIQAGRPYQGTAVQAAFVLQNTPQEELRLSGLQVRVADPRTGTAKFKLTVSVERHGDELAIETEYNSDLFGANTIRRLMASYTALLEAIAEDPSQAISSPPLPELPMRREPAGEACGKQANECATDQTETHDSIEVSLTRMWRDLLGMRSVGANDNFFELGGHSLLAARLIARVEREFGIRLSLAALFQAPTVNQLAALVRSDSTHWRAEAIPIQPAGSCPPFHCVGGGPMFYSLAKRLGLDQPFLGVLAPDGAALPSPYRLEDYAADQVESLRRIQADGPYFLGGWSASATLAYEVAQQLRAQGQEVSLLVLFDGANPASEPRNGRISWIAARLRFHALNLARGGVGNMRPYLRARWKALKSLSWPHIWSVSYRLHQRLGRRLPRWMQDQSDIWLHCYYQYRPQRYPGRVLLFRRGSQEDTPPVDELLGWGGLFTGRFEVCEVPGDHREIFREPNVRVMAEKLSESLLDARKFCRTGTANNRGTAAGR